MRIRTFEAETIAAAMRMVRDTIGDDAIILSTTEEGDTVCVTAAIEEQEEERVPVGEAMEYAAHSGGRSGSQQEAAPAVSPFTLLAEEERENTEHALMELLDYHGCPAALTAALMSEANMLRHIKAEVEARLEHMLANLFPFNPVTLKPGQPPVMLIGCPGVGKSTVAVQMLKDAVQRNVPVKVITTDTRHSDSTAMLGQACEVLKLPLHSARDPHTLSEQLFAYHQQYAIIIDMPGINPYDTPALQEAGTFISCFEVEPVVVQSSGVDPFEAIDSSASFHYLGASRLILSRLDVSRRHGGVLAAAYGCGFAFSHTIVAGEDGMGLSPLSARMLAALLTGNESSVKGTQTLSSEETE